MVTNSPPRADPDFIPIASPRDAAKSSMMWLESMGPLTFTPLLDRT